MEFNLKKILKALLLSNSEPLSIRDIQAVITRYHQQADSEPPEPPMDEPEPEGDEQGVIEPIMEQVPSLLTATQIRDAMDEIAQELIDQREVYRVLQGPAGYRIATSPEFADWVRLLRNEAKPMKLSQPALETLSIVAYRQPVTRAEMEAIRGVSVDSAVSKLLELELILVTGRADLPGRPIQYGTTDKFLEFIGVRSIEELPASDVLSPSQITEWFRQSTQQEDITDKDVGLPEEPRQEEVEFAEGEDPADEPESDEADQRDEQ